MWRIEARLVRPWLQSLPNPDFESVIASLELIAEYGPALGRPFVVGLRNRRVGNLLELRPSGSTGGARSPVVLFTVHPGDRSVLLIAGHACEGPPPWWRSSTAVRSQAGGLVQAVEGVQRSADWMRS